MNPIRHAPGVLCWISHSEFPENRGRVVEILRERPEVRGILGDQTMWECQAKEPLSGYIIRGRLLTREVAEALVLVFPQVCLTPISGPQIEVDSLREEPVETPR